MKKYLSLYLYGAIIIFEGLFLLYAEEKELSMIKLIIGVPMTIGAVLAFITGYARQLKQVQFAYHQMHALAMLVYGLSILLFCNTLDVLISFTAFLLIFYAFSEMIFCNWLFNLGEKVVYGIIFVRFFLGLAIGVGTFVAMNSLTFKLEGLGILFILVGINVILYVPVMKGNEMSEVKDVTKELSE